MFNLFKKVNPTNSSMMVQCYATHPCEVRHTQFCKTCKHNRGEKKDRNCYKQRKEITSERI